MKKSLLEKMFWNPNYFSIAIRKKNNEKDSIFYKRFFDSEIELKSCKDYWKADPILVQEGSKTFLFYEACHKGKGVIEVIELFENGEVSEPSIILEKEYHLSYPFVFKEKDKWYMIPESSANNTVDLYVAKKFPYEWEKIRTVLNDHAVDTSVYKIDEKYLMITFFPVKGSEAVIPKPFWLKKDRDGKVVLVKLFWDEYNKFENRGAGEYFVIDNKLYRPSQINSIDSYGNGIAINEVKINGNQYGEKKIFELLAEDVKFDRYRIDGLHTYTQTEKYEAIDVRCSFFDLLKPVKKVISIVQKR